MVSYYYLIPSLPSLRSDAQMPLDYNRFLELCSTAVSPSVYRKLKELTVESNQGAFLSEWAGFYSNLKNEVNNLRKRKMGKPCNGHCADSSITAVAEQAFSASDPLTAEKILLEAQFGFLDGLVSMHYFDEYVLFGYAMKLRLLERQALFEQQTGSREFKRLFDGIQRQLQN